MKYITFLTFFLFIPSAQASKNIPIHTPKDDPLKGTWVIKEFKEKICQDNYGKLEHCQLNYKVPGKIPNTNIFLYIVGTFHFSDNNKGKFRTKVTYTFYRNGTTTKNPYKRIGKFKVYKKNNQNYVKINLPIMTMNFLLTIEGNKLKLTSINKNFGPNNVFSWVVQEYYFEKKGKNK